MKHNRTLGGIGIAYHASMLWISVALITRMAVEMFSLYYVIDLPWYDVPDIFCDVYSLPFILLVGVFIYKKHNGLCDSVNLSKYKRILGELVISIHFAVLIAIWDMLMIDKVYIHVGGTRIHIPKLFLERIFNIELDGISGVLVLSGIYLLMFWAGYSLHHILKERVTVKLR